MLIRTSLLAVALAAALVAGCGGDDEAPPAAERSASTAAAEEEKAMQGKAMKDQATNDKAMKAEEDAAMAAARGTTVRLVRSQFGRILGDRRGQAFYLFDEEKSKRSECYGRCARAWPPVLTKGRPRAGRGVRARLLGTTRRRDGRMQVTYRGRPLYYYVDDGPGRVLCHNVEEFGGLWLVLRANGEAVS
jgi:predicted lipoprotein with Yx(FWY)xxD motif